MGSLLPEIEVEIFHQIRNKGIPLNFFLLLRKGDRTGLRTIANLHEYKPSDKIVSVFDFVRGKTIHDSVRSLYKIVGLPFDIKDSFWIHYTSNPETPFHLYEEYARRINYRDPVLSSEDEFRIAYSNWKDDLRDTAAKDIGLLTTKMKMFQELERIPPVLMSNQKMSKPEDKCVGVKFAFRMKDEINRLPDIFARCKSNIEVPYIQYNDESNRRLYKIFKNESKDTQPSYNVSIPQSAFNGPNRIFMYVWKNTDRFDNNTDMYYAVQNANKADFLVVEISLTNNILLATVSSSTDFSLMVNRVYRVLNDTNFVKPTEEEMTKFDITTNVLFYDLPFSPPIFDHMVMTDPLVRKFLYISDIGIISTKNRIYFRENKDTLPTNNWCTLTPMKKYKGQTVVFLDGTKGRLKKNERYVSVKFATSDVRTRDLFIKCMGRLLYYYTEKEDEIRSQLNFLIPNFEQILTRGGLIPNTDFEDLTYYDTIVDGKFNEELNNYHPVYSNKTNKLVILQRMAPDIFVSGYARVHQKDKQPIVIPEEHVDLWRRMPINPKFRNERRDVVLFPTEEDLVDPNNPNNPEPQWYTSPLDNFPFIERVPNKLSNRNILKYMIQCTGRRQKQTRTRRQVSDSKKSILTTFKVATPGSFAKVDMYEEKLVSSYRGEVSDYVVARQGTFISPNSFIHSMIAVFNPEHNSLDQEEAEEIATEFRRSIRDRVNLSVVKQEQYDRTMEEIGESLLKDDFFDPALWFRAMEEIFNCNIYLFERKKKERDDIITKVMIPRHKHFHVRRHRQDRDTVVLFKHYGMETNNLDIPQVELVVDKTPMKTFKLFRHDNEEKVVGESLYAALDYVSKTYFWDNERNQRNNYANMISYTSFLGKEKTEDELEEKEDKFITGQQIDSSGKVNAFEVTFVEEKEYTSEGLKIYVRVPPTFPLNIPEIQLNNDNYPTINQIQERFGKTNGITERGVLYSIGDLKDALVIPFRRRRKTVSRISQIRNHRKSVNIIRQILMYLYVLQPRRFFSNLLTKRDFDLCKEFLEKDILNPNLDDLFPSGQYDLDAIPRILPPGTFDSVVEELERLAPTLFQNRKLVVRTPKMLMWCEFTVREFRDMSVGRSRSINQYRVIEDFYTPEMMSVQPRKEYILSDRNLPQWKRHVNLDHIYPISNLEETVQKTINKNLSTYPTPYIYSDGRRKFIIQNVRNSEKMRALQIGYNWLIFGENTGYNTRVNLELEPAHVVYGIGSSGKLEIIDRDRNGNGGSGQNKFKSEQRMEMSQELKEREERYNDTIIRLVYYEPMNYAVMLPL